MREYVDALGGRVGVDAADGPGSVFWFTVPMAPPGDPEDVIAVGEAAEPAGTLHGRPADV